MSFPISPAVAVREIDLTGSVAEQNSSLAAFAGKFDWGPIEQVILVSDEVNLVKRFGKPNNDTAVDFFSIASFLAYSSGAQIVRVNPGEDTYNAGFPGVTGTNRKLIKNEDDLASANLSSYKYIAKYAGARGNSIAIAECTSANAFSLNLLSVPEVTFKLNFGGVSPVRSRVLSYTGSQEATSYFNTGVYGSYLIVDGTRYRVVSIDVGANTVTLDRTYAGAGTPATVERRWIFADNFGTAPSSGSFHVVVLDDKGLFSDSTNTILESFSNLSLTDGAVNYEGFSTYWKDVLDGNSEYIYAGGLVPTVEDLSTVEQFTGGAYASATAGVDSYINGYSNFINASQVDAPLIIAGDAIKGGSAVLANYLIESVAEIRKDCLVFISPDSASVVNNKGNELIAVRNDRAKLTSSSYATFDSGWKYMYDKYNNVFRWIPLNGDHAGLYARVDRDREVWTSAAGSSKGKIKNVVKLAWTPDQSTRDSLYINDVNPVTILPVVGVVMYGDKTLLGQSTAFSRINVRRLFITLEKTIAKAAHDLLFEFNDEFTQRRFVSLVEPFLRDVKGRRGISDFKVIADSTVNTAQVIQANRFVGQVFVKPNYSINFIRLDFVAVNNSASFEEVVGSI